MKLAGVAEFIAVADPATDAGDLGAAIIDLQRSKSGESHSRGGAAAFKATFDEDGDRAADVPAEWAHDLAHTLVYDSVLVGAAVMYRLLKGGTR